jgi:lysozyme
VKDFFEMIVKKHGPKVWDGHINEAGLELIKHYEGWRESVYLCSAARPTIGYGSTWDRNGDAVTLKHLDITKKQGEYLLLREVRHSEAAIRKLVKAELTENMFSSLCSFIYNVGSGNFQKSTMRMKLNRGLHEEAADEFPKWRRAGGRIVKGLVRRRKQERELFLA